MHILKSVIGNIRKLWTYFILNKGPLAWKGWEAVCFKSVVGGRGVGDGFVFSHILASRCKSRFLAEPTDQQRNFLSLWNMIASNKREINWKPWKCLFVKGDNPKHWLCNYWLRHFLSACKCRANFKPSLQLLSYLSFWRCSDVVWATACIK